MNMNVRNAITRIFRSLEMPNDRARANKNYIDLRVVNDVSEYGKLIAIQQHEWLLDQIADKTKAMYPDRYTDLSAPYSREELAKLQQEKDMAAALIGMHEQMGKEAKQLLPRSASQDHENDSDKFQGM